MEIATSKPLPKQKPTLKKPELSVSDTLVVTVSDSNAGEISIISSSELINAGPNGFLIDPDGDALDSHIPLIALTVTKKKLIATIPEGTPEGIYTLQFPIEWGDEQESDATVENIRVQHAASH